MTTRQETWVLKDDMWQKTDIVFNVRPDSQVKFKNKKGYKLATVGLTYGKNHEQTVLSALSQKEDSVPQVHTELCNNLIFTSREQREGFYCWRETFPRGEKTSSRASASNILFDKYLYAVLNTPRRATLFFPT